MLWVLIALLYADGQTAAQIGSQVGRSECAVNDYIVRAKAYLLGTVGLGTKVQLRVALEDAGWLS